MDISTDGNDLEEFATFNFNSEGGVMLSDIVLIALEDDDGTKQELFWQIYLIFGQQLTLISMI